MKNKLKGFKAVYSQNLRIHCVNTKYLVSTILVSVILLLGMGILFFMLSKPDKDEEIKYDLEKVYVVDKTELGVPDYQNMIKEMELEYGETTVFEVSDKNPKDLIQGDEVEIVLVQRLVDDEYILEFSYDESIESDDIDENIERLSKNVKAVFQNHVFMNSGLDEAQLVTVLLPVAGDVTTIGAEEDDEAKMIVVLIGGMLTAMLIYFMVLIYGQQICAEVPIEKTSKLVEQLLISVSPYALVSGKILAHVTACLIQFICWILGLAFGVFGGSFAAKLMYSLDNSFVDTAQVAMEGWFSASSLSPASIVLSIILLVAGLAFYLLLAGVAGCFVTKPEEAANAQSLFVLPLVVAFFIIFFGTGMLEGKLDFPLWLHIIPFTSALATPGSVLLGTSSLVIGIVSLLITVILSGVLLFLAAKVYEGLLFFNGNKIKFKDIAAIFKKEKVKQ